MSNESQIRNRDFTAFPLSNAFTVDVEEHFHVAALKEAFGPATWTSQASRVENNTLRILDILRQFDVTGTFFVLGWVADRHPRVVRAIVDAGHELACHGQSHQLIYEQEPAVFRDETIRAKKTLEDIAGVEVAGYRAASYSITPKSVWALDVIHEAGFTYDSSIVPARHDLYGFIGAPAFPHRIRFGGGGELAEFPPSTIRLLKQQIPIGGGGYFRMFPYWLTRWGLRAINNRSSKPFSFYMHPWEIDTDQPRVGVRWKSRFRHYTNLHQFEPRLRRLLSEFDFTSMRSIIDSMELPIVDVERYRRTAVQQRDAECDTSPAQPS